MKSILSFETAKALKYAGFPQPTAETGQFWFDGSYGNLSVLSVCDVPPGAEPKIMVLILGDEDTYETVLSEMIAFVFAPTATDILEQLGEYFSIEAWNGQWAVNQRPAILPEPIGYPARYHGVDTNAAEAAAAAWLELKKDLEV